MSDDRENGAAEDGAKVLRPQFGRPRGASTDDGTVGTEVSERASAPAASIDPAAKAKLDVFSEFIERGMVMVTVDARPVGVRVPPFLKDELQLNLNFSLKFFIGDFAYDERGVRASLSFRGEPFFCDLPWASVWMLRSMVDGAVVVSPDDVPEEVRGALATLEDELETEARRLDEAKVDDDPTDNVRQPPPTREDAAHLSSVPEAPVDVSPNASGSAEVEAGRPALRLVTD